MYNKNPHKMRVYFSNGDAYGICLYRYLICQIYLPTSAFFVGFSKVSKLFKFKNVKQKNYKKYSRYGKSWGLIKAPAEYIERSYKYGKNLLFYG